MRTIRLKWILLAVVLGTVPLWAAERTGILLEDHGSFKSTKEEKAIKKEQDDVMKMLIDGNKYHVGHNSRKPGLPRVMVVSCADSRVPPETVFHLQPGELFANRAFGNIVDKTILASLEYGVEHMNCRVLVVMGHTGCTAIKEAMKENAHPRPDRDWRSLNQKALYEKLKPAVAQVEETQKQVFAQTGKQMTEDETWEAIVRTNILNTMHEIRQQSPLLWHLEQKDYLKIVACIYHLDSGKVEWIKQ